MTMYRTAAGLLAAASAAALTATPAAAQQVDRIIAFGDSYADTGIAKAVINADPAAPLALKGLINQLYPTGRFSGGSNYIDTLSTILGVPVENYAVGGALATTFPVPFNPSGANNTNCGPGVVAGSPAICPLGFNYQVDQFLNVGTQSSFFPANTATTFDASDLVTISIGGNDARYYQQNYAATQPAAPFIAASIAGATAGINRLVAAGAPTISFLAGDTGRLPEILANPAAAAIRSSYSAAFNAGVQTPLAQAAASGVMVHYLDLNIVLDNILANPSAYGITKGSAANAYTCPTPTPAAPGCLVDSSGYLFYVDGLHLTSTGFAIVAQYVAAQLQAPLLLGGPSTIGLDNAREFGRSMTNRLDSGAPRDGDMPEGFALNLAIDGNHTKNRADFSSDAFRSAGAGVMLSADYGFGSGMVGLALRGSRQKAHYYGDPGGAKDQSIELGVYGGVGLAGGFVQGYAGIGRDRYEIKRDGVVVGLEADPKGHHALAGAKAGYLMPMAGMRIGPVVALDWAHAYIKEYAEQGDPALTLGVGSVKVNSLRGSLGVEARGDIDLGGTAFRPFAAAVVEKQFNDNDRRIEFNQQSAPTIINHWDVYGEEKDIYGRLTGGIAAGVSSNLRVDASVQGTVGRDGGNETSGRVAARITF